MRQPRSFHFPVWASATLMTASYVCFLASSSLNDSFTLVARILSVAGLLAGGVLVSGAVLRHVAVRCGVGVSTAAKSVRHFVGEGFCASAACLLGFVAFFLGMSTWDPEGASSFSEQQRVLSGFGWAVYTVFIWPTRCLGQLGLALPAGWFSWAFCSLLYGVITYVWIITLRHLITRPPGRWTIEKSFGDSSRST